MKETSANIENKSRKSGQEHKGDDIMKFTVTHNNKTFAFDTADELYIFGFGIELDVERKLNTDIETFVKTVREHHRRDCFTAPLKDFTEFILLGGIKPLIPTNSTSSTDSTNYGIIRRTLWKDKTKKTKLSS